MRGSAGVVGLIGLALMALAPGAQAQGFGIERFTGMVFADGDRLRTNSYTNTGTPGGRITDAYPDPATGGTGIYELAGGHPFIGVTDFGFNRTPNGPPIGGNVDNVRVDIPRGLMPNPRAFDRCTEAQLQASDCPLSSQIGTEEMTVHLGAVSALTGDVTFKVPLYNATPLSNPKSGSQEDVVARFAFDPAEAGEVVAPLSPLADLFEALLALEPVHIVGGVRDEPSSFGPFDYGLYFTIEHLPALDPDDPLSPGVLSSNLTFWGVPGDTAHDAERGRSCVRLENLALLEPCTPIPALGTPPDPSLPFLSNPTECTGASLVGKLSVFSAGNASSDERIDQTPAIVDRDDGQLKSGAQECQQLSLRPGVDVGQVGAPDSPAGPRVALTMAQDGLADREKFAEAHARDITVELPPGLTINPSAANGLEACSDAQLGANVGVPGGEACPAASRIGDVSVDSPLLPPAAGAPPDSTPLLTGSAYVGQPLAGDRYRLFVTVGGRKVSIRLKGSIQPDPQTGQLAAVFRDNPQLPFSELAVDFRDGPRAPLAAPNACGLGAPRVTAAPWSGTAPVSAAGASREGAPGCSAPGFEPGFAAATRSPAAGAFSPFTVRIGRDDGNQFLSGVRVDTPPGLAAKIKGVAKCGAAAASSGSCPAASRIGTATTTAGAGSEPYRLSGPVYFTAGYKGAPFGMVAAIRAIAGPYDLGTVVVRQAIHVDPEDASLSVVSDPLPQILEGVPIRLRNVEVTLDKRGFTYNPTSCGAKAVGGRLHSIQGSVGDRAATLAFDGCARLGFAPKLRLSLTGKRQLRRGRHPGLRARVTQPAGQANIASARVSLPKSLALDPANAAVCDFEAAKQARCPARTRIGRAVARSPVLNRPLSGPVYFVQGVRIDPKTGARIRTLPSLLAKLGGEIRVNVRATTDVARGRLVSTFASVPDAPVTRFDLRLKGGRGGVLAATGRPRICGRRHVAVSRTIGHNGKRAAQRRVRIATPCKRR